MPPGSVTKIPPYSSHFSIRPRPLALLEHLGAPHRLDDAGDRGQLEFGAGLGDRARGRHDAVDRRNQQIAADRDVRVHAHRRADLVAALLPPVGGVAGIAAGEDQQLAEVGAEHQLVVNAVAGVDRPRRAEQQLAALGGGARQRDHRQRAADRVERQIPRVHRVQLDEEAAVAVLADVGEVAAILDRRAGRAGDPAVAVRSHVHAPSGSGWRCDRPRKCRCRDWYARRRISSANCRRCRAPGLADRVRRADRSTSPASWSASVAHVVPSKRSSGSPASLTTIRKSPPCVGQLRGDVIAASLPALDQHRRRGRDVVDLGGVGGEHLVIDAAGVLERGDDRRRLRQLGTSGCSRRAALTPRMVGIQLSQTTAAPGCM